MKKKQPNYYNYFMLNIYYSPEVIAFNDHSRVEVFGVGAVEQNTASLFALVSALYRKKSSI
jgi:hypothetical protein